MAKKIETAMILPESPLSLEAAMEIQQAYLRACQELLDDSDYAIISGRKFRKRSGWAKLRRAFGISCEIVREERISQDDDWGYLFTVRATLPNGRMEDADGSCMASEFVRGRLKGTLHNVRAKALTRAKNRATSDILGAGIVSAEELTNNSAHWIDDPTTRKRFWAWAKGTLGLTEEQVYRALRVEHVHDFTGTPKAAKRILEEAALASDEER